MDLAGAQNIMRQEGFRSTADNSDTPTTRSLGRTDLEMGLILPEIPSNPQIFTSARVHAPDLVEMHKDFSHLVNRSQITDSIGQ
jgi:hypothetical protein